MDRSNSVVVLILIDGFRYDYINAQDSPFLHNLERLNIGGIVRETFAYQLRPAFFAGLYPEECGVAHLFSYEPEDSPFRHLPARLTDRDDIRKYVRRVEEKRGHTASQHYADSAQVPLPLLNYFGFSEKYDIQEPGSLGEHKTLFDALRERGVEWLWIAYPTHDQRTEAVLRTFQEELRQGLAFIYLHFAELDWVGHEYGPFSPERRAKLREIDDTVRQIYADLNRSFARVSGMIFGDHGMVEVRETVDVESLLAKTDLRLGTDYIYFLDSTQARFWFLNEKARRGIEGLLTDLSFGKVLTDEDYARLHFRFPDHKFGELIHVADDHHIIFPNFFQREVLPRGMHGYLPEVSGNWGKLIISGLEVKESLPEPLEMVSLYPLLLQMLGLPEATSVRPPPSFPNIELRRSPLDLSVVIPTYNRREILARSLKALLSQDYPTDKYEILVIDDGSTDETAKVAREAEIKSPVPLHYWGQEHAGPAAARNLGVEKARGKIILFLGDDIIATPNLLTEHMAWHRRFPALGMAVLGYVTWSPELTTTPFMRWLETGPQFNYPLIATLPEASFQHFYTSNISVKRGFLRTYGLFDEEFETAVWEDIELGYRLSSYGSTVKYNKDALAYHHHPTNLRGFMERQVSSGRAAALLWSKHPSLHRICLPNLFNPFLSLEEGQVEDLVDALCEVEAEGNEPVFHLYQMLLDRAYAHGFLARVETSALGEEDLFNGLPPWLRAFPPRLALMLRQYVQCEEDERALRSQLAQQREEIFRQKAELEKFHGLHKGKFVRLAVVLQRAAWGALEKMPSPVASFYAKLHNP